MFYAIFESDCPFAAFMRKNANKSFVRIVDYVRHAAMDYNRHNAFDPFEDDPLTFCRHAKEADDAQTAFIRMRSIWISRFIISKGYGLSFLRDIRITMISLYLSR